MDDIVDYMEVTSSRFVMFDVHDSTDHSRGLCELIVESSKQVIELMEEFKISNKSNEFQNVLLKLTK